MTRRKPYTPPRCPDGCNQVVAWIARADRGGLRPYDPKPVTAAEVIVGVVAHPIFGRQAWKPLELVEHFMRIRDCSRTDAEAEVADVDWHRPHVCPPAHTDDSATEGA